MLIIRNFQPFSPDWENAPLWAIIKHYIDECGLNLMPLVCDGKGSKAPKIKWKEYQLNLVPRDLLEGHFRNSGVPSGIGVICGSTSGNLEILDFDQPSFLQPFYDELKKNLNPDTRHKLVIVGTPSEGRHIYFRCPEIDGNQKLAYSEDGKIAIETRGQGGQAVMPGSPPATHRTGKRYVLRINSFDEIPTITPDDRQIILDVAKGLCKRPEQPSPTYFPSRTLSDILEETKCGDRPGDEFNTVTPWEAVLEPKGWTLLNTTGNVSNWQRPGKPESTTSATTGHCRTEDDQDLLHVFSSNAHPLEEGKTYTKFTAYCHLYHDGDFSVAAKALVEQGYGRMKLTQAENQLNAIFGELFN